MKNPITKKVLADYKKWLEKNYGKPCPDFHIGCICCGVWRNYEDLKMINE